VNERDNCTLKKNEEITAVPFPETAVIFWFVPEKAPKNPAVS
jgi:hypothetical protein